MNGHDELIDQLAQLEESEFAAVVERARRRRTADYPPQEPPQQFDRATLARWYAQRHLRIEPNIREVIYLPGSAPANEIRLLEVNVLSAAPDDAPVEVIDFRVDRDLPGEHRLLVADITPDQWEQIRDGKLPLPTGWGLTGNQVFGRRGRG